MLNRTICCFGELLLRFSPEMQGAFINKASMPVYIGGAELNAATALAGWGENVRYVTALPENYLATEIVDAIQQKNIDTSHIHYAGERIGSYYLPQGTDLKHNAVIYDRAYSSFSFLKPGVLNWNKILEGVDWFHFSAISPALNEDLAAVCLEALQVASSKGITISVDLNYRSKLWQYGQRPSAIMERLVGYCHVVMGNIWAANNLLDIPITIDDSIGKSMQELEKAAFDSMQLMKQQFPVVQTIAYTFRLEEKYFACLAQEQIFSRSRLFKLDNIVDKVGSGDCFMAGLIYGCINERPAQNIVDFAAAAAVLKLSQRGDATSSSLADVEQSIQAHE